VVRSSTETQTGVNFTTFFYWQSSAENVSGHNVSHYFDSKTISVDVCCAKRDQNLKAKKKNEANRHFLK